MLMNAYTAEEHTQNFHLALNLAKEDSTNTSYMHEVIPCHLRSLMHRIKLHNLKEM